MEKLRVIRGGKPYVHQSGPITGKTRVTLIPVTENGDVILVESSSLQSVVLKNAVTFTIPDDALESEPDGCA